MLPFFCFSTRTTRILKLSFIIKGTTEKVYKSYGTTIFINTIFIYPNIKKGVYDFSKFKINKVAAKNIKISFFMFPFFCFGTRTTRFLKLSCIILGTTEKGYKSYSTMTFSDTIFLYPNIKKGVCHFSSFKINKNIVTKM